MPRISEVEQRVLEIFSQQTAVPIDQLQSTTQLDSIPHDSPALMLEIERALHIAIPEGIELRTIGDLVEAARSEALRWLKFPRTDPSFPFTIDI